LNSLTACSKEVTTGMTGPMGSGLPQLGLPRRLAIVGFALPLNRKMRTIMTTSFGFLKAAFGFNPD
jgi:hypothetical protein